MKKPHVMPINNLLFMVVIHFVAMYILMYSMVNAFVYAFPNLNQVYMAGIMTAPMLILEIIFMGSMYESKKVMNMIMGVSILVFILFFFFIRQQIAIGDKEFLRSMIPHHAGALLMCNKAQLKDPEIKKLCQQIISSQQIEINQMEQILNRIR